MDVSTPIASEFVSEGMNSSMMFTDSLVSDRLSATAFAPVKLDISGNIRVSCTSVTQYELISQETGVKILAVVIQQQRYWQLKIL